MVLFQTILQASAVLRCSLEGSLHVGDQRVHTHLDLFCVSTCIPGVELYQIVVEPLQRRPPQGLRVCHVHDCQELA